MPYFIILLLIIGLAILVWKITKGDWMSPGFVTCAVYGVSVVMAIIGFLSWNKDFGLSGITVGIVTAGLVGVVAGDLIARWLLGKMKISMKLKQKKVVEVPKWVCIATIGLMLLTIILTYFEIRRICLYYDHNPTGITDMLAFYRTKTLLFDAEATTSGVKINFIVDQLQKICYLASVFNMVFLVSSWKRKKGKIDRTRRIMYIIIILLGMVLAFLTTSRSMMVHFAVAFVVIWIIEFMIEKKIRWKKALRRGALIGIVALTVFYILTPLIGRDNKMNMVEYISFYLGTPISSLNKVVKEEEMKSTVIGERTFYGIHYTLARVGITKKYPAQKRKGVVYDGYGGNNMFSSFGMYYLDFGVYGVVGLSLMFGFITTLIYIFARRNWHNLFVAVLFAYYYYVMIDQIRGDLFFNLLSISTLTYFAIAYVMYRAYLLFGRDIHVR